MTAVLAAQPGDVTLTGEITIATVVAVRHGLIERLPAIVPARPVGDPGDPPAGAAEVRIFAAEVTELDAAGAQLLYALVADIARCGAAARWVAASPELIAAATALGMRGCLGLPGEAPR
jgi:hypothetical protein